MERYWFPAKGHGWGWGLPVTWQGWAVLALFVVLLAIGSVLLPPVRSPRSYLALAVTLSAGLVVICWWTGEPPAWR